MNRQEILKKAGKMVCVYYNTDGKACFAIGWFYALSPVEVRLKVTSTKYETYENIPIEITDIDKIEDYDFD